jgi:hypothetical protein
VTDDAFAPALLFIAFAALALCMPLKTTPGGISAPAAR